MAQVTISSSITQQEAYTGRQRKVAYVNGYYYVFYSNSYDIWYVKSTDSTGSSFGSAVQVNTTTNNTYSPAICVVGTTIHITYHCTANDYLYYKTLDTTTDTLSSEQHTADLGSLYSYANNQIAVTSGGRVYVATAYSSTYANAVLYTDDGGTNWTEITSASMIDDIYYEMICNGTDLILVQVNSTSGYLEELVYNGASWSGPTNITTMTYTNPTIALAVYNSNVYLEVMNDGGNDYLELWKRSSGVWGYKGQVLAGTSGTCPVSNTGLSISTNNGRIYLVWIVIESSYYNIYYSRSLDDGVNWESAVSAGFTSTTSQLEYLSVVPANNSRLGAIVHNYSSSILYFNDITPFVETYSNRPKANIKVSDNTKNNSVKARIVVIYTNNNSAKANIKGIRNVSAKANIKATYTSGVSTKAQIINYVTQANYSKMNVLAPNSSSAKANISAPVLQNQYVKGEITGGLIHNYAMAFIVTPPHLKTYSYLIFDSGSYVTTWSNEVLSEPGFRTMINGGPGEIVIRLDRHFDDFGEDVDVKLFNKVEIWVYDRDAVNGELVYSGFISGYRPVLDGHSEYVEVTLLPYMVEFSQHMLHDSSGGEDGDTLITYSATDPSDILRDIIDKYQVDGGTLTYTADSIDDTGTTVDYTFSCVTIKEALDKLIELTPDNWYWRVGADNVVHLHESNMETADHEFVISKNIGFMETWRRAEDLINRVYFVGKETGSPPVPYYWVRSNTGSVDSYGIHAIKKVESQVDSTANATAIADRVINRKKDPEIRTTMIILDNNGIKPMETGYDIESVHPGDTMRIRNIKQAVKTETLWDVGEWDVDVWDQTLAYAAANVIQILSVEYTPNQIRLEASSRLPEIQKRVEDVQRGLEGEQTKNAPTTPTAL